MQISIIVPVYNVEQYISKCLDSIISQSELPATKSKLEILIINDGSADNSQEIIDQYSEKYSFVKSFVKENGGVSDARNFGITKATGNYIWFVDPDDWIAENALSVLYAEIQNEDLDILEFDYSKRFRKPSTKLFLDPYYSTIETDVITGKKAIELYGYNMFVWNRIFKRQLLNDINFEFPLNRTSQEAIPVLKALLNADKYKKIKSCLYFYHSIREGSTTNIKDKQHLQKRNLDMLANIGEMSVIMEGQDKKIVSKINEIQTVVATAILATAVSKVKSNEHFRNIVTQLKQFAVYPIRKHPENNSLKWKAFRVFVNSKILTMLFFILNKE